jgi:hypothetical protein
MSWMHGMVVPRVPGLSRMLLWSKLVADCHTNFAKYTPALIIAKVTLGRNEKERQCGLSGDPLQRGSYSAFQS